MSKKIFVAISNGVLFGAVFYTGVVTAQGLDLSFLQGGDKSGDASWSSLDAKYVPGRYLVDIIVNEKWHGKRIIDIGKNDTEHLCLSKEWLDDAQIYIDDIFYHPEFDAKNQCYFLSKNADTDITFDFTTQSLAFVIPQSGLAKTHKARSDWDYGASALRFNYTVNGNKTDAGSDIYASSSIVANVGSWLINSSMSATKENTEVHVASAIRAIQPLKADLSLGKTYGGSALTGGASMLGASLRSNSAMSDHRIGFAPVFSGVAKSYARVTLLQGGGAIYSEMVSPGPFTISHVDLLNNGDVTMIVTEADGSKTEQLVPLSIVSGMLTPGELEYDVNLGVRDNSELGGGVTAVSLGYGFDDYTLRSGIVAHPQYGSAGMELMRGLGIFGTMSARGAISLSDYKDGGVQAGRKQGLTYAKKFGASTELQVTGDETSDYVEFSAFDPWKREQKRQKEQYNVAFSHRVTDRVWLNATGWRRTYWDNEPTQVGLNGAVSSYFDSFSVSVGGQYTQSGGVDNYGVSASISIPFSLFDRRANAYALVNSSSNDDGSVVAGMSSSLTDKLSYSVSAGQNFNGDERTRSLQSSYEGDGVLASMTVSQGGSGHTSSSASMSGAILALPEQGDVIFTRNTTDTIAIANVEDTSGVMFTQSPYPTNSHGNTVIPISSYTENNITLDGSTLPVDMELLSTNEEVVPTDGAVVYVPFGVVKVKHFLLQIKNKQGEFIDDGSWAVADSGMPLGFITQHGVLFISSVDKPKNIKIGQCVISGDSLKDISTLQEVICESE